MGKEALPSLCPPGFWLRFNFVHLVSLLVEIRFSFVNSWARDDGLLLDDFVTPWSDPNPSSLGLQPPESRVSTNRSFCVLEKTPLLLRFLSIPLNPWGLSLKSFGDVFSKSSSSSPQNLSSFGLDLIRQSSSFFKSRELKNRFWERADLFLSPIKPALVRWCVGSTGE